MTKWTFLGLLIIAVNSITISYAEEKSDDWHQKIESINREAQLQREQTQLQLERYRLESQKMDADIAALLAAQQQIETARNAKLAAQEQAEAAKKAEEAVDEIRSKLEQVEVKRKDQLFLGIVILMVTGFLWSAVRKSRKGELMKYHEKFGIVVVLVCVLLTLLALMISEPWVERFDFIQNLMSALRIRLLPETEGCEVYASGYSYCQFAIDFPAKYAVLSLLALAAYGFTTYLGITPALKKKNKIISETTPDTTM
ncbi:MAG: hypothetical protein Q7T29_10375 [Gallionella sp.]|nr:hypothetical protein [Gallionella sp.]